MKPSMKLPQRNQSPLLVEQLCVPLFVSDEPDLENWVGDDPVGVGVMTFARRIPESSSGCKETMAWIQSEIGGASVGHGPGREMWCRAVVEATERLGAIGGRLLDSARSRGFWAETGFTDLDENSAQKLAAGAPGALTGFWMAAPLAMRVRGMEGGAAWLTETKLAMHQLGDIMTDFSKQEGLAGASIALVGKGRLKEFFISEANDEEEFLKAFRAKTAAEESGLLAGAVRSSLDARMRRSV